MKTITTLSLATITALFIGCGGGSSGTTTGTSSVAGSQTSSSAIVKNGGIFVDAPVQGLSYTCQSSGTSGTTDATGRYDCAQGDTTVTFGIGSRNLGTTAIADVITPKSFFYGTNREDEILNLAQLLQTMDKDGNPDNGIELDETAILNWQSNHTGFDAADFDSEIANILGKALVNETVAREHMNSALATFGISGIDGGTTSSSSISASTASSEGSSSSSSTVNDSSSLTVKSPNDVKGYRFTSKNGTMSQISATYMVEFDCNGNFYYTQDISYQGHSTQVETRGTNIDVQDTMWGKRLHWSGIEVGDEIDTNNNDIYIDAFDKITINESCFVDSDCSGNFYLKSIEKIATCN